VNLTADRLRELLSYDSGTGIFRWKVDRKRAKAGMVAGSSSRGYLLIGIDGRLYRAHRLAWLYEHGRWPELELDHVNGDRSDNRIANLREATADQQRRNQVVERNSRTGFKGVRLHRKSGLYHAKIRRNGKTLSLKYHPTVEAAHAAYMKAASEMDGEFFRPRKKEISHDSSK
jgi:HNH endonuclease/AP2 domain